MPLALLGATPQLQSPRPKSGQGRRRQKAAHPSLPFLQKCAVEVLRLFLQSAGTAAMKREHFPQLCLALLGQTYLCGGDPEELAK